MSFLLCFYWACRLTIFFEAAMPTHDRSGVRTTDLLYRTRQRYPHSAPPKYFGVPQMSGCLSPRHLCVLLLQYQLRHGMSNRFSRAHCKLMQTYHGGGELLALLPPLATGTEHRAKVLCFCPIMFARTPSQLFEAFECQHHPAEVSHSQLWQLK